MTSKDFILIATVMLYSRPCKGSSDTYAWNAAVKEFARVLPSTNSSFDRARFIAACGGLHE
jgi:hypothetical protein